ncbi:MAG: sodium-dependent phosphate transporter [Gracilibacter sp. BRH_c7a]|nr:MAG: sodium-dependent phosphate transporter [Gracilibacter sp. BRH_c7a]
MDITLILFNFLGGLGLFLFGIKAMSDGLQSVAGDKMRLFLEKGTSTPLRGVLTGTFVTALIQSSSGTTVLAVGLVNAGLLSLRQAIGIIMGANIGTTVTAYLIGFDLKDYALPIIALGVFLIFFSKNKKFNYIGQVIFGFGLLFFGMDVMGQGMKPLRTSDFFINLMTDVEHNVFLGVLIGTIFTGIVQSSSATTGILQELAHQGAVTLSQVVPILFGINVGTTITALLAGIGASVVARRAALSHFFFNVIGTMIFLPLFLTGIFLKVVIFITDKFYILIPGSGSWETLNIKMQIAQIHGVFNITNTILLLPFVTILAAIVTKFIPSKEGEIDAAPQFLEPRLLTNLPVALSNAKHELLRMGNIAYDTLENAVEYFFTRKDENQKTANSCEAIVDKLQVEIESYVLRAISGKNLTSVLSKRSHTIMMAIGDIERVGDHAQNIVELADYASAHGLGFSDKALGDLEKMTEQVKEILLLSLEALEKEDKHLAQKVIEKDNIIDEMEKELRKAHIARVNARKCNGNVGAVYLDILSNLERIGDHSVNVAGYVIGNEA